MGLQRRQRDDSAATARRGCPRGSTVEDWPFGYEELEPYYDKVEYEVGVSGQAGNVNGTIDPRGNIFEAPRKRDYPMPPLRGTAFIDQMAAAARTLGWHPFPGPAAINSRPYQNRSACMYHGFCNRGGCHVDAKNSTAVTTIPRAADDRPFQGRHARARDDDRRRRQGPRDGRHLRDRRRRVLPAGEESCCSRASPTRTRGCCCCRSRRHFPTACRTTTARSGGTTSATIKARRLRRCSRSTSTPGTACRRRASPSTTLPTTISTTAASISSAAAISGLRRTAGR